MKKVLIILPYKVDTNAKEQKIDFIYQTYIEQLVMRGVLPVLCPSFLSDEMIDYLSAETDGILLLGGADIDPKLYGQEPHEKTKAINPDRDRVEELIIKKALKDKKSILGICRGMQIVNVLMGGTLIQELTEVVKDENHMVEPGSSYDDVATYRGQTMKVKDNTLLASIIGVGDRDVHCAHHQAIDKVATSLRVNAESPAGVIEGLESASKDHYILLLENHIETQKEKSHEIWESFVNVL